MAGPLVLLPGLGDRGLGAPPGGEPAADSTSESPPDASGGRPGRCGDDRCIINHLRSAWTWDVNQPLQTVFQVAAPPQIHRRSRHPHQLRDQRIRDSPGGQQHDPRPLPLPLRCSNAPPSQSHCLVTITKRQGRGWFVRHASLSHQTVKLFKRHATSFRTACRWRIVKVGGLYLRAPSSDAVVDLRLRLERSFLIPCRR